MRYQRTWRRSLIGAAAVGLVVVNVPRVERSNIPAKPEERIEVQTQMPKSVAAIFHRACEDCHTELTHWPWYSNVSPFLWLVAADVYGAREHMNLSKWGRYTAQERTDRLIDICEMVAGNKLPL